MTCINMRMSFTYINVILADITSQLYCFPMEVFSYCKTTLGSPTYHGWSWDDETQSYTPVMKTLNTAPESVVQLNIYKYTMGCSTLRCKCKKRALRGLKCASVRTARTQILS